MCISFGECEEVRERIGILTLTLQIFYSRYQGAFTFASIIYTYEEIRKKRERERERGKGPDDITLIAIAVNLDD